MNKSQTILAAIGGTVVVGALVLGYFIWDASSAKTENGERLESSVSNAKGVIRKLPVKAEAAELKIFKDNVAAYDEWRAEAGKIAARGDTVLEKTTSTEFKTTMVADARRLSALPGCIDGKFVKGGFGFGFPDYITGGTMPPKDEAGLKRLQREWNDVSSVLKTLAECGGVGIGVTDVTVGKAKAKEEDEAEATKAKGKKAKRKKLRAKAEDEESANEGPAITSFTVDFTARPAALVKALNAFTTGTRFVVVEDCTFVRDGDALAAALGGGDAPGERSAKKRGRKAQQEEKQEAKAGIVTDPATAPMLKVRMAISVYDFGTLEKAAAEEKDEEAKEGEAK